VYSSRPGLVIGFHGCDKSVRDAVVNNQTMLHISENGYDWLGRGMYFWENNLLRALHFAQEQQKKPQKGKDPIGEPSVLSNPRPYDSVRAVFIEGEPVYPSAGFHEKTHIQLCIRNPNCIKGFFIPREKDPQWVLP
jgi:hypothetical protein